MNWKSLDKNDTNLFKGLAIILIVTHNFMHLFPLPKENEFDYSADRIFNLLNLLWSEPGNSIRVLLSFFGHFGVQIFVFLSAYGLAKKFLLKPPEYGVFIRERLIKIYPSFILAILFWIVISGWRDYGLTGPLKVIALNYEDLLLKITLLSNFFPGKSLTPVGPWWFIPFIFQFYLVFPVLLTLYRRWGDVVLVVISAASIIFAIMVHGKIGGLNIYFTILGHLPEVCLGLYLAKKDHAEIRLHPILLLLIIAIYILGNLYETFWYLNHLSFLIILLLIFTLLIPKVCANNAIKNTLLFFGSISMPLFLVNGFMRAPFINWAISYNDWLTTIALCLIFLGLSVAVAITLSKLEKYLVSKVSRTNMQS